jgi:hypothetical protein
MSDHLDDRLVALHTMLDPQGTSLLSIEELVAELQAERSRFRAEVIELEREVARLHTLMVNGRGE